MNPMTNEVADMSDFFEDESAPISKEGFEKLPESLHNAAKRVLKGKKTAFVSKTSGGKLSKWAAKRRKEIKEEQKMVAKCNAYYSKKDKGI